MRILLCCILIATSPTLSADIGESVFAKYAGKIDLSDYVCQNTHSSFVHRICYQPNTKEAVANLGGEYYKFCGIPAEVASAWVGAQSKGRFFNASIKGKYQCYGK